MKRRFAAVLTGVLASSLILAGCQASKGLETKEIKISQYRDLEVTQVSKPEEVTDEQVDTRINSVLESKAEVSPVTDRAVENGDTANIDFVGKIEGKEFEGGSGEGYPLEIGSGSFIPGFEESVIGHKIGDTYDWNGQFPENYGNADYAGKDVVFTITVNSISESIAPELNDEFVKTVSDESKTVDEYKTEIKNLLKQEAEDQYKSQLSTSVMEKVLENTEITKYPDDEVKKITDDAVKQYKEAAQYQNIEFKDYLEQNGVTEKEFNEQIEDAAKDRVKQTMVFNAIAEKEKLELTDEVYEKQLENLARSNGFEDVDALKEAAEEDELKEVALYNIVLEWLADHCIQKAS